MFELLGFGVLVHVIICGLDRLLVRFYGVSGVIWCIRSSLASCCSGGFLCGFILFLKMWVYCMGKKIKGNKGEIIFKNCIFLICYAKIFNF